MVITRKTAIMLISIATLAAGSLLRAGTYTWTNSAGGLFSNPANWNPNGIPDETDNATFNADGAAAYTVEFTQNSSNALVQVADDHVTWLLNEQTYTIADNLKISTVSGGHLVVTGGTLRLSSPAKSITIPIAGTGSFELLGKNTILDMENAEWLKLEKGADGTVVIRDATFKNAKGFDLGGNVVIDGGLVTNITTWANVARGGVANVVVTNAGRLILPDHTVGHSYSGSKIMVTGTNSLYHGLSQIANGGDVEIVVTNGGVISGNSFYIGYSDNAAYTGSVIVAQGGRLETSSFIMLGGSPTSQRRGHGHLTIQEGGTVSSGKSTYIWTNSVLRLDGGTVTEFNYNGMQVRGGLVTGHGNFLIPSGGTYLDNYDGIVRATGPMVFGSYRYKQLSNARLELVIGGREYGQYGCIALRGTPNACNMYLDGTCKIELAPGFRLQDKDTFQLLQWGTTLEGEFDTLELPEINGEWITDNLYVTGEIKGCFRVCGGISH